METSVQSSPRKNRTLLRDLHVRIFDRRDNVYTRLALLQRTQQQNSREQGEPSASHRPTSEELMAKLLVMAFCSLISH